MAPGIHAATGDIRIHGKIAISKEQIITWMKAVVTPLIMTAPRIVAPGILSAFRNVRVLQEISFREEHRIGRIEPVSIALAQAVNDIMLPRSHPMPVIFRIKQLIAGTEKAVPVSGGRQAADEIPWIKSDFHGN